VLPITAQVSPSRESARLTRSPLATGRTGALAANPGPRLLGERQERRGLHLAALGDCDVEVLSCAALVAPKELAEDARHGPEGRANPAGPPLTLRSPVLPWRWWQKVSRGQSGPERAT
jgi:hypothetical protein